MAAMQFWRSLTALLLDSCAENVRYLVIDEETVRSRSLHCQVALVIHFVHDPQERSVDQKKKLSQSSFKDVLAAELSSDPLMSRWKRLQIACTIAVSVLYLHETGWIPNPLQSTDLKFLGLADSSVFDMIAAQPVVSAQMQPNVALIQTTPFDCPEAQQSLEHVQRRSRRTTAQSFPPPWDCRVTSQTVNGKAPTLANIVSPMEKDYILAEVEKIPFGRTYRELFRVCLEGRLYATSTLSVDTHFQKAIVEQLLNLEKHFSAIIIGE
ncbi:hypothetical protein MMC17_007685 [Xylographa soralifera]|nr:hypothetical protein [Xylographa soralifera]